MGQERRFGEEDLIVSKTDTRGVIRYVNDVFVRVSGYAESQLLGQPHSIIRHPLMPRGVFHLLWQTIGSGQELFAYINNLAADGSHYWVLAHVTPSFGPDGQIAGFHSNRRWPERTAIAALEPLYARMRAEEARHTNARQAAAASCQLLVEALATDGTTYEEYVWSLTTEAMAGAR